MITLFNGVILILAALMLVLAFFVVVLFRYPLDIRFWLFRRGIPTELFLVCVSGVLSECR